LTGGPATDDPVVAAWREELMVIVDVGVYDQRERCVGDFSVETAAAYVREHPGSFCWIGLHDPVDGEVVKIARTFPLPALAVEDAEHAHQRAKVEGYPSMTFGVIKTLSYSDEDSTVEAGEIASFIGRDFLVTVRHGAGTDLRPVRERVDHTPELLDHGPTAIMYALYDHVVDHYREVALELERDLDDLEVSVFSPMRTSDSEAIYRLKQQMLITRRALSPLNDALADLLSGRMPNIDEAAQPFLRDLADHVHRSTEHVSSLDYLLNSIADAHAAQISVQQNDDMRKISAYAALITVPTLIAGIYGMNFVHMPELAWRYGYPGAVLVMAVICFVLYRLFRRSGWL
jgi:magnesium transporter